MSDWIEIDGSYGEGGGQILRTSLALSALLERPLRMTRIRSQRKNPGLAPQHLTGVRAVAAVCEGRLQGAQVGSQELTLEPGSVCGGSYSFDIGTAGSTSLVLQTLLPPLLRAKAPSKVRVTGGTNVPWSPVFEYLDLTFRPAVTALGLQLQLERHKVGFYPKGGGDVAMSVQPLQSVKPARWTSAADNPLVLLRNLTARVPDHVNERQGARALQRLQQAGVHCREKSEKLPSRSPGTCLFIAAQAEGSFGGFTSLGERGKRAEQVADQAADEFLAFCRSGAAVDCHLADQLLIYLALAEGDSVFTTERITQHLLTNAWAIERFLGPRFEVEGSEGKPGQVTVRGSPEVLR